MQNSSAIDLNATTLCEDGLVRPWPDAGVFLGVSRPVIFRIMQRGDLPYSQVSPRVRMIPRKALVEYAERRLVCSGSQSAESRHD
jgi:hypothetical protein